MSIRFINKNNNVPVKLFDSIDTMNNSTGNKEGDLALVYASIISNWTVDTQSNVMIFPETVILENTISNNIYFSFKYAENSEAFLEASGSISVSGMSLSMYGLDFNVSVRIFIRKWVDLYKNKWRR